MIENTLHRYEYDIDINSDTAPAYVTHMVGENKRVLEFGPGPGSITRLLQSVGNCRVTGVELDREAIKKLAPYCDVAIQADLNSDEWPDMLSNVGQFDVIVAADVLEHLYDPWTTLQRMVPFLNSRGYLVISLPNAGHASVISCLFNGDFEYQDNGLLDRTHIRFFGLKNIESLFAQADLKIIEARYVIMPPEETALASNWSKLPPGIQKAIRTTAHFDVYQVVIKAVPLTYPGDKVPLAAPEHAYRRQTLKTDPISWRTRLGRHLSPQLKQHIRKSLKMMGLNL